MMFIPLIKNEHYDKSDGDYIKDINVNDFYICQKVNDYVNVIVIPIMFILVSSTPDTYLKFRK